MKYFLEKQIVFVVVLCLNGCLNPPDIQIPDIEIKQDSISETTNFASIVGAYKQSESDVLSFDPDDSSVVSCYVISSDEAGNFYKILVVQDDPENPMYGLEIKIDLRSYFTKYNVGRKLFLKMGGLSITQVKGKYIIGYLSAGNLADIPESLVDQFISRTSETFQILPKRIELEDISSSLINCFVNLKGVQFSKEEIDKSFASEPYDKYYGERLIEQCENQAKALLFTSTYADYRSYLLPKERFSLSAVLTIDYYSGDIVLILNNLENIQLLDDTRCDPVFFRCQEEIGFSGTKLIYYEDFEKFSSTKDIEKHGWINTNVNFGNGRFRKRSTDENTFLQVSAYGSNEYVMEVWLVSPIIDLSNSSAEYLSFDSRATYEEGLLLTVWFSQDYVDDIGQASWHQLEGEISRGTLDNTNSVFHRFNPASMDCVEGKIRLGFRYLGSDPGKSTTYDIDNILILGDIPGQDDSNKRNDIQEEINEY